MSEELRKVRIDRIVLRGLDVDPLHVENLRSRIIAELRELLAAPPAQRAAAPVTVPNAGPDGPMATSIASNIAHSISIAGKGQS